MKKLFFTAFAVCALSGAASALSILNPLYMPDGGRFFVEAGAAYQDSVKGGEDTYLYNLTAAYSVSDSLQLGGYIGYADYARLTPEQNDFTNPGVFAYYRILDNLVVADIGAEAEFKAFDNLAEGGVADGADKYTAVVRAAADLPVISFGAIGKVGYWDLDQSMYSYKDMINGEVKAFALVSMLGFMNIGAEAGYQKFNMDRDDSWRSRFATARFGVVAVPSVVGAYAYATVEDNQAYDHTNFIAGIKARVAI